MRRIAVLAVAVAALGACASAGIAPDRLRITAEDAFLEARTAAESWDEDAVLRYVEGVDVSPEGYVRPGRGFWRFVYDAPGRAEQLAVTVTPRRTETEQRPPQSPPGFVIGDRAIQAAWIDSPTALRAALAEGVDGGDGVAVLLVPLAGTQWVVGTGAGRIRIDAQTGAVVE